MYKDLPMDVIWIFEIAAQSRKKNLILRYKTKTH